MLSLYVHWPFCLSKCIYCDFGSQVISKEMSSNSLFQEEYFSCCKKQLIYFKEKIKTIEPLTTIYFGGGTPSLINPKILDKFLTFISTNFKISSDCEITLEANPTSFETEKFKEFKDIGINRLSIGVQSMDNNNLLWLGRQHTVEQSLKAIDEIKKIFQKWSCDLIYGLPKQSLNQWLYELKIILSLKPQHISLYTLIVDDNTPLGHMVKAGNVKPKTDDELALFYNETNKFIKQNSNLIQYEVSNYAINGFESRHNIQYWNSYDYIGIGAGAHGRLMYKNDKRYERKSIFNPKIWKENILQNAKGLEVEREINRQEQVEEILIMGLRTKYGINIDDIKKRFNFNIIDYLNIDKINLLKNKNYINFSDNILVLTESGLIILDSIINMILK